MNAECMQNGWGEGRQKGKVWGRDKWKQEVEGNLRILSLSLQDGLWAGVDLDPIMPHMPHIHTYQCPTPYCSCHVQDQQTCETLFYQKDPGNSRQCHSTRRGKPLFNYSSLRRQHQRSGGTPYLLEFPD